MSNQVLWVPHKHHLLSLHIDIVNFSGWEMCIINFKDFKGWWERRILRASFRRLQLRHDLETGRRYFTQWVGSARDCRNCSRWLVHNLWKWFSSYHILERIHLAAGVGLNLATAFSYMDVATQFVSVVGRDPSGDFILSEAPSLSKTSIQRLEGTATGQVTKIICLLFYFYLHICTMLIRIQRARLKDKKHFCFLGRNVIRE